MSDVLVKVARQCVQWTQRYRVMIQLLLYKHYYSQHYSCQLWYINNTRPLLLLLLLIASTTRNCDVWEMKNRSVSLSLSVSVFVVVCARSRSDYCTSGSVLSPLWWKLLFNNYGEVCLGTIVELILMAGDCLWKDSQNGNLEWKLIVWILRK